ncbi:uncharacterized protein N0V89_007615 [Didymosphaeria variabile]|uniref:Uncharacterized protein n=1 Tax=Didymosphaeria variabile TaxID=1932322 RepID=A0A9W9CAF6_9PLEO|nr:uncharacterized protein N0V89_007615 [Didymosphaeria variabile]KAJ4352268.1 hypothetical protein N0V89_007615 [Didymosphaeria variabile]
MEGIDRNAALEELRMRCKSFRAGESTVAEFNEILDWATEAPRAFGVLELKHYFAELDPHQVTKPVPEWAEVGRKKLWSGRDRKRSDNLEKLQTWTAPPKPTTDEFGLVRLWPCYMESLRPLPAGEGELLKRANEVYRFVAGVPCFEGA